MTSPIDQVRPLIRTRQNREFTSDPVTDDELQALAQVARWSGSSSNSQPWRFVVVRDVQLIRQIAEIALPQTRALRTAGAALAISMPDEPSHAASHAYDEGRVAERILIGASMLGLGAGITWLFDKYRPQVGSLLGVGDDRFVRTIMAIGHPTDRARQPRTAPGEARHPLAELVEWR
jgi:nitroreductase